MFRRSRIHRGRGALAAVALLWALGAVPSLLQAQPMVLPPEPPPQDQPAASFRERYSPDHRAQPIFTRPETEQILASLPPWAAISEGTALTPPVMAEASTPAQIPFAAPKGPAKILKELLTAPEELLIPKAEAGPDAPPPSQAQGGAPAPNRPAATGAPSPPPQATAPEPVRNAEPLAERPPAAAAVPVTPPGAAQAEAPRPDQEQAAPQDRAGVQPNEPAPQPEPAPPPAALAAPSADAARPQNAAPAGGQLPPEPAAHRAVAVPHETAREPRSTAAARRRIQTGRATWYQHPGRTASGEPFNPNQLTAAHHTLPFGTRVRVVNPRTGRSVDVRINDRIPRKARIVIDLSRASARAIGLGDVGRVALYVP